MKKILLLVCCAPDATHCVNVLREQGYKVTTYFYNPCIHPAGEYSKRLASMKLLAGKMDIDNIEGVPYDTDRWYSLASEMKEEPECGKRCTVCFSMRLKEAARKAKEMNIHEFASTLTISPHKNAKLINKLGQEAAARHGINYYISDFKKMDGFKKSIVLSKEFGLYRQNYCGCVFSKKNYTQDTKHK